jgi:hypothetical protein
LNALRQRTPQLTSQRFNAGEAIRVYSWFAVKSGAKSPHSQSAAREILMR